LISSSISSVVESASTSSQVIFETNDRFVVVNVNNVEVSCICHEAENAVGESSDLAKIFVETFGV